MKVLLTLALVVAVVMASVGSSDHLAFDLKAVKNANALTRADHGLFCFKLESPFIGAGSELLFVVDVECAATDHTDVHRFGGTNMQRGKQSLDMAIYNAENGDLVRARRNMPLGTTVIEINPFEARLFRLCFVNLSYDSSWRFLDAQMSIKVRVATYESLQSARRQLLSQKLGAATIQELERCASELQGLVDDHENCELLQLESQRRDFNERVFTRLLYGEVAFTAAVLGSQIWLAWSFICQNRDRTRDVRRLRKSSD